MNDLTTVLDSLLAQTEQMLIAARPDIYSGASEIMVQGVAQSIVADAFSTIMMQQISIDPRLQPVQSGSLQTPN